MKKHDLIILSIFLLPSIFAVDCTNALRIGANKARGEKAILKDIKKYNLNAAEHYSASNQYVDFYMQFIKQNIHVSPANFSNFCFIFNQDGYLLKKRNILKDREGGCSVNKFDLLKSIRLDSTINLNDTSLIDIDSSFNFFTFVDENQIQPLNENTELSVKDKEYLAVLHWGVFCNRFNRLSMYQAKYIEEQNLPFKPIYLNIDYKE